MEQVVSVADLSVHHTLESGGDVSYLFRWEVVACVV